VVEDSHLVGYEAPCPKCGHMMVEPFARMPRRKDGIIVVECPVHGPFHFKPAEGSEAKLVPGEPMEG
jgi:hypothetical protein